jgi:UDP-N-acetylglucosamine 2-epimerase (non-hydrolysing)
MSQITCMILGTRPEVIKFSPIIKEYTKRQLPFFVVHTGQHYSAEMSQEFFDEFGLATPEYNLNVAHVPDMITGITNTLKFTKPDLVMVLGDTNTTLAGALSANRCQIPLAHVEAGLRSFDIVMAEEVNRMIADHLSTLLFVPTQQALVNLVNESIGGYTVVGNTIADVVHEQMSGLICPNMGEYILATVHRAENVDNASRLESILYALDALDEPVYFPVHPRTRKMIDAFMLATKVKLMPPVGYKKMLQLLHGAKVVVTDSGGIQEEACILKVPCVTVRENTERPETVELGANVLVGTTSEGICRGVEKMRNSAKDWDHPYGSDVAKKIVDECQEYLS